MEKIDSYQILYDVCEVIWDSEGHIPRTVFSLLSLHPGTETGGLGKVQILKKGIIGSAEATVEK